VTTQPGQALAMMNGKFLNDQAADFARRLREERPDDLAAQVRRAYQLAVGREPDETNLKQAIELIDSLQQEHDVPRERALQYFCLLVYNMNEFLYLD
jgi:hypothetical protein